MARIERTVKLDAVEWQKNKKLIDNVKEEQREINIIFWLFNAFFLTFLLFSDKIYVGLLYVLTLITI